MRFIGVIAAFTLVVAVMGNSKPENEVGADPNTESEIGTSPNKEGEESGHLIEAGSESRHFRLNGTAKRPGYGTSANPFSFISPFASVFYNKPLSGLDQLPAV